MRKNLHLFFATVTLFSALTYAQTADDHQFGSGGVNRDGATREVSSIYCNPKTVSQVGVSLNALRLAKTSAAAAGPSIDKAGQIRDRMAEGIYLDTQFKGLARDSSKLFPPKFRDDPPNGALITRDAASNSLNVFIGPVNHLPQAALHKITYQLVSPTGTFSAKGDYVSVQQGDKFLCKMTVGDMPGLRESVQKDVQSLSRKI